MVSRLEPSWMRLLLLLMILILVDCQVLSILLVLCYYLIYIAFYFELADDTYSVLVFCTDPYLYVFLLFIVECNKRTVVFN